MVEFFTVPEEGVLKLDSSWKIYWEITGPITVAVVLCILLLQNWRLVKGWAATGGFSMPPKQIPPGGMKFGSGVHARYLPTSASNSTESKDPKPISENGHVDLEKGRHRDPKGG